MREMHRSHEHEHDFDVMDEMTDEQRLRLNTFLTSVGLVLPPMSSHRGREVFLEKGCVVCHSVNGIGGKAAPALDAESDEPYFDVFDFAARMWRGAPTMIVLQEMELGYQIELSGDDLAHLAAFASNAEVQSRFSDKDIPEVIRDWMVDEVYQELDPDYMTR
jgi:cytochrome c